MNKKIIIKSDDFSREIFSFLKEVGADMPIDWDMEALDRIRNAVIEAFEKMGVMLEIDSQPESISSAPIEGSTTSPISRSSFSEDHL